jgi:hypothetical protein
LTVVEGTGIEDGGAGSGILERRTGDKRVEVAMVEARSLFEKCGRFWDRKYCCDACIYSWNRFEKFPREES